MQKKILKRFKMEDYKPISTPIDYGVKLTNFEEGKVIDLTFYKSLVVCSKYFTCTRSDILYGVKLLSHFIEKPNSIFWKAAKRILCYIIQSTISHRLLYSSFYDF